MYHMKVLLNVCSYELWYQKNQPWCSTMINGAYHYVEQIYVISLYENLFVYVVCSYDIRRWGQWGWTAAYSTGGQSHVIWWWGAATREGDRQTVSDTVQPRHGGHAWWWKISTSARCGRNSECMVQNEPTICVNYLHLISFTLDLIMTFVYSDKQHKLSHRT